MLDAGHIPELKRMRREVVRHRVKLAQELGPRPGGMVRPIGLAKILDAIAGRDQHRFAQAEHLLHLCERLGQLGFAKRHLLPHFHGHVLEGESAANNMRAQGSALIGKTCATLSELMPQNVRRMKTYPATESSAVFLWLSRPAASTTTSAP